MLINVRKKLLKQAYLKWPFQLQLYNFIITWMNKDRLKEEKKGSSSKNAINIKLTATF